jgi:hypothetical protein
MSCPRISQLDHDRLVDPDLAYLAAALDADTNKVAASATDSDASVIPVPTGLTTPRFRRRMVQK